MQALQTRYIDALNDGLNGWYAVRVEGCRNQPCTGQPIPIRITAAAVANNPDLTINVVNRGGRGNAGTICVGDFNAGFAAHEGGHQVLGLGDEYRESDPALRQRVPLWARDERVRTDLTRMGSDSDFRRFALYHERHFRFAQVFLEAVYRGQGCTVTLEAVRSPPVDFRIDLGLGYASASTGTYLSATGFLGVGVPLERQRRLTLLVGAQGQLLENLAIPDRRAFLLGARLGLEGQTTPGSFGLSGNISASGGVLHQPESTPPPFYGVPPIAGRTSPYGELSAGIGIQSGLTSGVNFRFGVEAAAGRELSNDPNAMRWLRFGFNVGAAF